MSRGRVLLFGLMIAVFGSGYGVMFTVLDDFRDEYGIPASWLGMIVAIGFASAFVAQVAIAPIADRGRARAIAILGAVLNIAGLIVMAFGTTAGVLMAGRLVAGLGAGMAIPAIKRIVINADPANIGNNLGTLFAADVAGFAFGPVVSALLVPIFGLASPFLAIAAASALVIPAMVRVPIAELIAGQSDDPDALLIPKKWFAFDLLASRPMVAALMLGAAAFLMIGTFDALWAIVLDDLQASDFVANLGITVFAIPLVVLGPLGGRLAQRFGPFRLGPLGIVIGAGFMFLYGQLTTGAAMLAVGIIHAFSDGLTIPSAGVGVGVVAPPDRQAGAQGLLGAAEAATGAVTAALAGVLYDAGGRELAYTSCSIAMIGLAVGAYWLAGPDFRGRRSKRSGIGTDPHSAVTGHSSPTGDAAR